MKNFIIIINIGLVMLVAAFISNKDEQAVSAEQQVTGAPAKLVNVKESRAAASVGKLLSMGPSSSSSKNEEAYVKDFIYQISEARIMDMEQGKLASQRATSRPLKDYGSLMVSDQQKMLKDLSNLARSKNMDVASTLGESKTEGLSDLQKLHGKKFDTKFIKMMVLDHRRDIRKLEKATNSKDADVQVFATKYLPIVKSHLEKIESIKDAQ